MRRSREASKGSAWDKTVPVEESAYLTKTGPLVRRGSSLTNDNGRPNLVDLFCGCGGFSAGFRKAGFNVILGIDHHIPSCNTFALNHPEATTIVGDIREVGDEVIADSIGPNHVHVVAAGVPCQGFSLMNRKRSDEDQRNLLFREFIRVIRLLQPDIALLENVSGLPMAANGAFKEAIALAIAESGYHVEFRALNALDFGVPQRRERVFFVGLKSSVRFPWPRPSHGPIAGRPYLTVRDAIGDLPPLSPGQVETDYSQEPMTEYQALMRGSCTKVHNHQAPSHEPEVVEMIARTQPGEPMYPSFKQRIRLHPDQPSPTQVSGGIRPQFQLGHPWQARGLSVRERCRIQSFPDEYEICGGIVMGRVQTGNAVPPLLASTLAGQILRVLTSDEYLNESTEAPPPASVPSQMGLF